MQWFRLYSSVVYDPKVQRLHPATFKHWINILCLANENKDRGMVPCVQDVAYSLRVKPVEVQSILSKLEQAGLLDKQENGKYAPHNWTKFQRIADDVATRVRRYRKKKANNTYDLDENVTLPKHSVDTDTDTERIKKEKKKFKPPSLEEVKEYCQERNNNVNAQKFINHYESNGWMVGKNKMKDWKAAVRTWEGNNYGNESQPSLLAVKAVPDDLALALRATRERYEH